jgi:hypothetical protein
MVAPIDVSQINFFTPIASFLLVFIVIYAVLQKSKILGESKAINAWVSFVMSIIFISFSSTDLYVRSIVPWFVVLLIIIFLVLITMAFTNKEYDKMLTSKVAWGVAVVLIIVFLIVAINVFNPVFNQDKIFVQGDHPEVISQAIYFLFYSKWAGSILLIIVTAIIAYFITRK